MLTEFKLSYKHYTVYKTSAKVSVGDLGQIYEELILYVYIRL